MELKNKTILQVKVGERTYEMECYSEAPLGEVYDALLQMKSYVVDRINAQCDNEKKSEEKCQASPQ